jgi:hypothetical protein
VKSNPRPTMPKLNALKIKNKTNIQAIKLNIFNKFYQKESFEILKQTKFEVVQSKLFFVSISISYY